MLRCLLSVYLTCRSHAVSETSMTLHVVSSSSTSPKKVTLLILGAGWTYQFLEPLLQKQPSFTYAATTSTGHDGTIAFNFDPESDDPEPFRQLPQAEYVLVTFPLKGKGPSKKLVGMYAKTHPQASNREEDGRTAATQWIQLGSTGIYTESGWSDNSSPIDPSSHRGIAEEELISLDGCVLNLAGLYGAQRQPGNWISRVAKSKDQLAGKGAVHLIHGVDVARAVIGVVERDKSKDGQTSSGALFGRRWIIADCVSYDWWSLVWDLVGDSKEENSPEDVAEHTEIEERAKYRQWVMELMQEQGVKGLPRSVEALGRKLDAREFWMAVGMLPERTLKR